MNHNFLISQIFPLAVIATQLCSMLHFPNLFNSLNRQKKKEKTGKKNERKERKRGEEKKGRETL